MHCHYMTHTFLTYLGNVQRARYLDVVLHLQNINTIVHVDEPLMLHWYHQPIIYHFEQYASHLFMGAAIAKLST
jgi:hypothetical protein